MILARAASGNAGLAEYLLRILVRLTRMDDYGKLASGGDLQLAAKDLALNFAG